MQDLSPTEAETAREMAPDPRPAHRDAQQLEWLRQRCGISIEKRINRLPGQTTMVATEIPDRPVDRKLAIQRVSEALRPATGQQLAGALAVLAEVTSRRDTDGDLNLDLRMQAYVGGLKTYPSDIALFAVSTWKSRSEFWPRWYELEQWLDLLFAERRHFLPALQALDTKAIAGPPPEIEKTDEDKAEVRAMCDSAVAKLKAATAMQMPRYNMVNRDTTPRGRAAALAALPKTRQSVPLEELDDADDESH